MAGKAREIIDLLVQQRAGQSPAAAHFIRTKLILRGIDPDKYTSDSPDDAQVLMTLREIAREYGLQLKREP